jgi:long-chain acyl-CoA synthetase
MSSTSPYLWQSSYSPKTPLHLSYPSIPLYQFLEKAAEEFPDQIAISFFKNEITYKELLQLSNNFAEGLLELGVRKGDRIAIMLPNIPQAVIAYFGILFTGAIVVQTNPLYTESELEYQLKDSGSIGIICLDLLYPKVQKVKKKTSLQWCIVTGIQDYLPFPKNILFSFSQWIQRKKVHINQWLEQGDYSFRSFIENRTGRLVREEIDPEEDLAVLQYTGGTTGRPKGAMLTHANLVTNVEQCKAWFCESKKGEEKFLSILPFFHVYGLTVCMNFPVAIAARMILTPRFQPKQVLKLIHSEKPTIFPGAPTMYIALLQLPELKRYDLTSIRYCISGSAPLPVEIIKRFENVSGCRIVEGYGLTECSPITHVNPLDGVRKAGSIGIPVSDTVAKVVDLETGEEAPVGQLGELYIKGPQVMKGYWKMEEETKAAIQDGWLLTGDIGKMDLEGYFYIVERKKDMIIAGGYKIYPREVEEVLYEHPAVKEAVVVGVPDPYRGETVKAFIVLKDNMSTNEQALNAFCRERLAPYKVPRKYEFRSELPKTIVGKILRRVLIEEEKLNEQK